MPHPASRRFAPLHLGSLALAACLLAAAPSVTRAAPPAIGQPAPALIVRELDGHRFDLAKLRGKVVLVNFWATWCSPCRVEMPTLNAFYRRYHARGLDLLGLSIDQAPDDGRVRQVMRQFSYPGALASGARVNGFGEPVAVPVTYVIDARGVLRAQLQAEGPAGVSVRALERAVLPLLARRNQSPRERPGILGGPIKKRWIRAPARAKRALRQIAWFRAQRRSAGERCVAERHRFARR